MNKTLKIFTMTALLGVLTAGCANSNANINSLDKNLMNLETSVRNSIAGNASDFFINEFECPACDSTVTAKYNARTNVLEIGPTVRDNNTRPLITKNVDTYRRNNRTTRNTTNNATNSTANNNANRGTTFYGNYFITDGSYTPRYSELRDESVVANKVKNIENLYSIAYDVSLAKAQFNELKEQLLTQIENTRNNLEAYENINEAQQNALNQYALTIRNIINTINNSNELYKNNMVITGTQTIMDNQVYRSAQYINMLNCIDTQISALENAIATLDMINNSILTDADQGNTNLPNKNTDSNVVIDDDSLQTPTTDNNTTKTPANNTNNTNSGTNNTITDTNNDTINNNSNASTLNNANQNANSGVVNNTNRNTSRIVPNIDTMDFNLNNNRAINNGLNANNGVNNGLNGTNNATNGLNNRNTNIPINSGRNISNMPYNSNMANNNANGINNNVVNNSNSNNRIANNGVVNNANRNTINGLNNENNDNLDGVNNTNNGVLNNANNNIIANRGQVVRNTDSYNIPTVRNNVNTYNYNTLGGLGGNRAVNGNQNLPSSANTLLNNQTPPPSAERYMRNKADNGNTILNNANKIKVDDTTENKTDNDGIMLLDKTNDAEKSVNPIKIDNADTKKNDEAQYNNKMPLIDNDTDKNAVTDKTDSSKPNTSTNNTTIKGSVNSNGPTTFINDSKKINSSARA